MGFLTAHLGHFRKAARTYCDSRASGRCRAPGSCDDDFDSGKDVPSLGPGTWEVGVAKKDPEVWTDVDINNIRPSTEAKVIDTKLRSVS